MNEAYDSNNIIGETELLWQEKCVSCQNKKLCEEQKAKHYNNPSNLNCQFYKDNGVDVESIKTINIMPKQKLPNISEIKDQISEYILKGTQAQLDELKTLNVLDPITKAKYMLQLNYFIGLEKITDNNYLLNFKSDPSAKLLQNMNVAIKLLSEIEGFNRQGGGDSSYKYILGKMGILGNEKKRYIDATVVETEDEDAGE